MSREIDKLDFGLEGSFEGYQIVGTIRRTGSPMKLLTIKPYFLGLNRVDVEKDAHFPNHCHSDYELIIVESGPYSCKLNGSKLRLEEGQGLLVQPGDHHEVFLNSGQRHVVMQFSLQSSGSENNPNIHLFSSDIRPKNQIIWIEKEAISDIIDRLQEETKQDKAFSAQIQDALTEEIFWILLWSLPDRHLSSIYRRESRDELFLKRLFSVIESNLTRNISVESLAKQMQYSRSAVTKKCKSLLKDTPEQIVMKTKVRRAVEMLNRSDRPVKEIGYQLGFKNPYHFSRVFKRYTGMPPSQIRPNTQITERGSD